MPAPAQLSPERGKRQPCPLILNNELFCRCEFKSYARQTLRCLDHGVELLPRSRIMHDDPFPGDCLENHEVVHVPVEDSGEPQLTQVLQLVPERPAKKMKMARDLDQRA